MFQTQTLLYLSSRTLRRLHSWKFSFLRKLPGAASTHLRLCCRHLSKLYPRFATSDLSYLLQLEGARPQGVFQYAFLLQQPIQLRVVRIRTSFQ